ncbi:hypothetical protein G7072_16265 [Nocardioides sp. HDW12B]|uniref:hypothetical protein n=1 Tax=Nocardioides sp. HDW12B TaxID=2714939 RepID=UPI00140C8B67|nr:hypothetical protein [Nocardioides sp. HDW12B]QIK67695.1 hypothetical protein G7072_16265 [Nocardioides sp. HDW12B]
MTTTLALPSFDDATVVVAAPGPGPGNWSGAASAVLEDGVFWLTYRVRRPLAEGRGVAVVVARSDDGVTFETVAEVAREEFGAESFERPVVVRRPDGGWRLYLSCATPGTKHWWIEALDADTPEELPTGSRTLVLPGSATEAVKDPVIVHDGRTWQMWVCVHPLDEPGHEDRMTTAYATSDDGLTWTGHGTVLRPTPGAWDARGARVTALLSAEPLTVLYDGRARAEDNWHEVTGVARADGAGGLVADPEPALVSSHSDGALRYAAVVPLPGGGSRWYAEVARPDGAHDLVTVLAP